MTCACRPGVVAPFRLQPTARGLQGLGTLGATTGSVAGGAAAGAAAGSVAGPIGTVAGAVIGAVASLFGGKSNPQIQIDKTAAINLFNQYANVAGTVSGRSIGIANMNFVMRGAMFTGHFPKCQSTGWIDMLTMQQGKGGGCDNCFGVLWQAAKTGAKAPGGSGANTGNNNQPVRDAKTFVDRYVWPSNSPDVDTVPWVTATDAIGKQIVYDAADAYLAEQDPSTYVLIGQNTQQPTINVPGLVTQPAPATPAATTLAPAPAPTSAATGAIVQQLSSPYGLFQLGPGVNPAGDPLVFLNGKAAGAAGLSAGVLLQLVGGNQVWLKNSAGSWYQWTGSDWAQQSGGPPTGIAPVGSPTSSTPPVQQPTPGQIVSQPPAVGMSVIYAPDKGNGGAPTQVPAGFTFTGLDPYNGSWIMSNGSGQLWVTWQGNIVPYSAGMFAPASPTGSSSTSATVIPPTTIPVVATPSPTVATTSGGAAVTQADIQALIAQLASQGATAQQAYSGALQTLQSQGVTATPQVQAAVQSAVQSTPAPTAAAGVSGTGWLGLLAIGGVLLFATARPAPLSRKYRRKRLR